ncbi:MAG: hypothetical protein WBP18_19035 [Paracoccaceae bacterium]
MKKIINFVALAILAGLAVVYFTRGPNVLLGGPSKSAIVEGARAAMVATAPGPAEADLAKAAGISPKGLCSKATDGGWACIVEVQTDGAAPTTFVAVLKKGADGVWVAGE